MNIAVTGGSGFVGSHLSEELSKSGHKVIIVDKMKPENNDIEWIQADFGNLDDLKTAFKGIDLVYHLGAIADASLAYKEYKLTFDVNVIGTYNVLEAARLNDVKRVVYASTIWVYNSALETEVDENTKFTTDTQHVYTTTKFFGEYLCYDFFNMYKQNFTILRFPK